MRTIHTAALQSEINVTPLVDVCLVLLIIFMVMTPLLVTGMPVNLPRASTGENVRHDPLKVTISADRVLSVGDHVLRMEDLPGELGRQRAQANRPVIVRADKSLSYGDVVAVLDACRSAGFDEVGLGTASALDQRP
jgi:biopolymer transport protein ExbD